MATPENEIRILHEFLSKTRYPIEDIFFLIRPHYLNPKREDLWKSHDYLSEIRLAIEEAAYARNIGKIIALPPYEFQMEVLTDFVEATQIGVSRIFNLVHQNIKRNLKGSALQEKRPESINLEEYFKDCLTHLRIAYAKLAGQ